MCKYNWHLKILDFKCLSIDIDITLVKLMSPTFKKI